MEDKRLEGLIAAPDFPVHLDWLNTDRPFSLKDFRGKIVLLDFWTFCCINCMHVLPDLKRLEEKYPEELVVIGIHSAKFENEKGTESIRQAILRYGIKHPVLNDRDMEVWETYAIRSWPTLVLINPDGRIIGVQSGEGIFELFDEVIGRAADYFKARGRLKPGPFEFALEPSRREPSLLAFPGKIRGDEKTNRLFITDSNHHRILVADPSGKIRDVIGGGAPGAEDGTFETARFFHPQGVFPEGDFLYIADTENHLIRRADLKNREVRTLLGTGVQGRSFDLAGRGTAAALNSPWDLLVQDGKLFIAMAGPHQIYRADLETMELARHAGSGREARFDGPLLEAALAQPSGITTDGKILYFADSEVSSVRAADISPEGNVRTLIGEDLFEFGDVDGGRETARLQHALGVEYQGGLLYVADTYNSKIKVIDPAAQTSRTYAGTGRHGAKDGPLEQAEFFEPGGLAFLGGKLYIADTNNHAVRVLDPAQKEVRTLELTGIENFSKPVAQKFRGRSFDLESRSMGPGDVTLRLTLTLPKGYKFALEAPSRLTWVSGDEKLFQFPEESSAELKKGAASFPLTISARAFAPGAARVTFGARLYYCREDAKICLFEEIQAILPLEIKTGGPADLEVEIPFTPPPAT